MDSEHNMTINILLYFKDKFSNVKNSQIYFFSSTVSAFLCYRYLKNKELYSEHHGHFNSPRNIMNKFMINFYFQEVIFRFAFGIIFIGGGIVLLKNAVQISKSNSELNEIKKMPVEEATVTPYEFSKEYNNLTVSHKPKNILIDGKEYSNVLDLNSSPNETTEKSRNFIIENEKILKRKKMIETYLNNK